MKPTSHGVIAREALRPCAGQRDVQAECEEHLLDRRILALRHLNDQSGAIAHKDEP